MKKIFTKISTLLLGLFMGITITACATDVVAEQTYPLKIWMQNRNGQMETWNVVDEDTGVNYIVVAPRWGETGYEYNGVTITPRLNADGSLYTSK